MACTARQRALCSSCGAEWPALRGIPDFRDRSGAYVARDLEQAAALDAAYEDNNRDRLVELSADMGSFYHDRKATPKLRKQRISIRQDWQAGARTVAARLEQISRFFAEDTRQTALDVGAGSGLQLTALADRYREVVGIDASMSELILARKLLDEQAVPNVTLACAYAEQLPLEADTADFVVSMYVLEHVGSAETAMTQVGRVLKPGGSFYFAVPFRYTWIPPEPHTHVWWVGWLPRAWQPAYVRLFKPGFDFQSIHLFSFGELRRLAQGFPDARLFFFNPGFQADFPPVETRRRQRWERLNKFGILLSLAGFFLRRSIHAVLTLSSHPTPSGLEGALDG
jgi:ubiquinone/menaquinone biosynthesis C-methylase UbiE